MGVFKQLLLVSLTENGEFPFANANPVKIGVLAGIAVMSTLILCPLEVVASKLAIQRNHAAPEYNSVSQEVEDGDAAPDEYVEYAGAEEDVIG